MVSAVVPLFLCWEEIENAPAELRYQAYYSYENPNSESITLVAGSSKNRFLSFTAAGQPSLFLANFTGHDISLVRYSLVNVLLRAAFQLSQSLQLSLIIYS